MPNKCSSALNLNARNIIINFTIAFVLFCTMFLTFGIFVEAEILSKWYAFVVGSIVLSSSLLFTIKKPKLKLNAITIVVIIFIGYLLVRALISGHSIGNVHILSIIAFFIFYLTFKLIPNKYIRNIDVAILCVCITQCFYGLMQYAGIFHTYKVFKIVGSFDNPAGFAACLAVGFPFALSVVYKGGWRRYFGLISLLVIALGIVLSGSRAGIVAIIIVSCVYFGNRYLDFIKKNRKYLILLFIALLVIAIGLFLHKKDSAVGRMLIWSNSCEMVKEHPVFGGGAGSFMGHYMTFQADYFEQNPDSRYSILAGNVTHPFNEFLSLTIEYGIIGLILLCLIALVIIKSSKQITIYHLSILSIGIFACFSYPLRYPFIAVILAYSLASIKSNEIVILRCKLLCKTVIAICIGFLSLLLVKDIKFEYQWGMLVQKSKFGKIEQLLNNYEQLHSRWNGDPMFLYNYGAILNRAGQYEKSNAILDECTKYFNDYDVQMIMADNYFNLEQWNKSETHYTVSHNMIPNKFMPLYKLMKLYEQIDDVNRSQKMAKIILNKTIKIPSATIRQIQNEAENVVK